MFRVILQFKNDFCAVSEGISTGIRIYFKTAFIGRGAEDILRGVGMLGRFWGNRSNRDFICDKETRRDG